MIDLELMPIDKERYDRMVQFRAPKADAEEFFELAGDEGSALLRGALKQLNQKLRERRQQTAEPQTKSA